MPFPTISLLAYFGYAPFDPAAVGTELADRLYGVEWRYGQWDEGQGYEGLAATVYLDNADGAFNADNPASPYYPDIKPAVRMQLFLDGDSHFLGFVKDWPFTTRGQPGTPAGQIKIDLTDALGVNERARLMMSLHRDSFNRADQDELGTADAGGWLAGTGEAGWSVNANQAVVDLNVATLPTPTTVYDDFMPYGGLLSSPAPGTAVSGHVWTVHAGAFAWATAADYGTYPPGGGAYSIGLRGDHGAAFDIATVETFLTDCAIEPILMQTTPPWRANLVFRYTDVNNFWYVEIDWGGLQSTVSSPPALRASPPTTVRLVKRQAGVETSTLIYTATSLADAYPVARIELDGDEIRIYRGVGGLWRFGGYGGPRPLLYAVTDSFNATATRHGVGYRHDTGGDYPIGGPFDRYNVYDLGTPVAPLAVAAAVMDTGVAYGYVRALLVDPSPVALENFAAGPALLFRYEDAANFLGIRRVLDWVNILGSLVADDNYIFEIFDVTDGVYTPLTTVNMTPHDESITYHYRGAEMGGDIWAVHLVDLAPDLQLNLMLRYWRLLNPDTLPYISLSQAQESVTIADLHPAGTGYGVGYVQDPYIGSTWPPEPRRFDDFYFWEALPAEFTHERVSRLLDYAGYPSAWRAIAEGRYQVAGDDNGIHPWLNAGLSNSLFQSLADAEFGRFFFDHRGYAVFETNETRGASTASVEVQGLFGASWDGKIPVRDWTFDSGERHIRTEVVVDGLDESRQVNPAAERAYGQRPGVWNTAIAGYLIVPENVGYYRRLADLFLTRYAHPVKRLTSIEVDYWAEGAAAQVLDRRIGDRIQVDVPPPWSGDAIRFDCLIEGVAGRLARDQAGLTLRLTWALSPSAYAAFFLLDDPTFGVLDVGVLG